MEKNGNHVEPNRLTFYSNSDRTVLMYSQNNEERKYILILGDLESIESIHLWCSMDACPVSRTYCVPSDMHTTSTKTNRQTKKWNMVLLYHTELTQLRWSLPACWVAETDWWRWSGPSRLHWRDFPKPRAEQTCVGAKGIVGCESRDSVLPDHPPPPPLKTLRRVNGANGSLLFTLVWQWRSLQC